MNSPVCDDESLAVCSGALRNPNLNLDHEPLKFGPDAASQPWGKNLRGDASLVGPRPDSWWTGKPPIFGECPGVLPNGKMTSLSLPCLKAGRFTRQGVIDYFNNTWTLTEVLFSALQSEEAFYRPPYHQLRHPFIFYYGHVAVLYINKLRVAKLITESVNPLFEELLETGVDEMSWDDMSKNNELWPAVAEVTEYRRKVYQIVLNLLQTHPRLDGKSSIGFSDDVWAIFMGMEHERIHIETTSALMRELPVSLLMHPLQWPGHYPSHLCQRTHQTPTEGQDYPANEFVSVSGSTIKFGRGDPDTTAAESYGWDNEFGEMEMGVGGFDAKKFLCSNGEYWEFVSSGGYIDQQWWNPEGWKWRQFRNCKWPTFWVPDGPQGLFHFKLRTMFRIIAMPWNWPVVVNRHEAIAYCHWLAHRTGRPCRILTEAEHRVLRETLVRDDGVSGDPVLSHSGTTFQKLGLNTNLGCGSESAVDAFSPNSKGIHDAMGNVWTWCEDWFSPLKGFRVNRLYDDFSTPCFDNKHAIIMGGSFISTGNMSSVHARFHFRPHFFQHAGFRVVVGNENDGRRPPTTDQKSQAEAGLGLQVNVYETPQYLNEYLSLHYAPAHDVMPYPFGPVDAVGFPVRCARLVIEFCRNLGIGVARGQALDLGCAVGRATFELSRHFDSVVGIDLSELFIKTAQTLQSEGRMPYQRKEEGCVMTDVVAEVDKSIDRSRVTFKVGDACSLPPDLGSFDAVLAANLIDRLPSPKACLSRMGGMKGIVAPGGLLVLLSPYTWMEQFTPKGAWLGGYVDENGKTVSTKDGIAQALGEEFEFLAEREVPLIIREHVRKFQYIVSQATVWRRRGPEPK